MGRNSGYIAINSGIAGGAVATIIPEETMKLDELFAKLDEGGKD
jgi:6-phosphofructokinase 1